MKHVYTQPVAPESRPAGSLLGNLARFAGLATLTVALVAGALVGLVGLGGKSAAAPNLTREVLRNSVVQLTNVARASKGCGRSSRTAGWNSQLGATPTTWPIRTTSATTRSTARRGGR